MGRIFGGVLRIALISVCAVVTLAGAPGVGAHAGGHDYGRHHRHHHEPVVSEPIVEGLAGPLQFEVDDGRILVGQAFSGTVSRIGRDGSVTDLFNQPGVEGVARGPWGSVIATYTAGNSPEDPPDAPKFGQLRLYKRSGEMKVIADTRAYEEHRNPDGRKHYGLMGLSEECAAMLPPEGGILPYKGIVDSHPYAVTPVKGGWLVADAGANDILFVSWSGWVKTVATLPPEPPVTVTAEAAAANQLPPCVEGASYVAEAVPTDVEVGPDGMLYVSTLPGGPENPTLGARGAVYRINPWNGHVRRIGSGFAGAANLAVTPWGDVYVSELFGGQVSKLVHGGPEPIAALRAPAALEWDCGRLYVGYDSFGSGKIATIDP